MYCTGLCSPAESTKCFLKDTETDLCCLILVAGDVQRLGENFSLVHADGTGLRLRTDALCHVVITYLFYQLVMRAYFKTIRCFYFC